MPKSTGIIFLLNLQINFLDACLREKPSRTACFKNAELNSQRVVLNLYLVVLIFPVLLLIYH